MHRCAVALACFALCAMTACGKGDPDGVPPAPFPDWVLSHWVWEDEGSRASATQLVDDYRSRGIPVGALIIDSPWETGYNTFVFDEALYDDPRTMIDGLHNQGVRVVMWITSMINEEETELYANAAAQHFLMQRTPTSGPTNLSWWKGSGALLDYFNPAAVDFWHGLMDPVLDLGIDGWKADGTDPLVVGAPYSPTLGRDVSRAEYGEAYYRDLFDYSRTRLGNDRVVMSRPYDNLGTGVDDDFFAYSAVDMTFAGWVGDQDGTFPGLVRALENMLFASRRNHVIIGSDIGGYREDSTQTGGRSKELFIRWAQLGAFCPLMENGGGGEHRPWMFDEETVTIYRRFVLLHEALRPYLGTHGSLAHSAGAPLMRFTSDSIERYELGPDIQVTPLVTNVTSQRVTAPAAGNWLYLFDPMIGLGPGESRDLEVPLGSFPVLVRDGSAVWTVLRTVLDAEQSP